MVTDTQKLLLRAFNSECDELVSKVKYTNFDASLNKIQKIIQIAEEAILERAVAAERAAAERARQTQTVHQPQVLVYA